MIWTTYLISSSPILKVLRAHCIHKKPLRNLPSAYLLIIKCFFNLQTKLIVPETESPLIVSAPFFPLNRDIWNYETGIITLKTIALQNWMISFFINFKNNILLRVNRKFSSYNLNYIQSSHHWNKTLNTVILTNISCFPLRHEHVFKTFSRLQEVFARPLPNASSWRLHKTSLRLLQDAFKTSRKHVKTSLILLGRQSQFCAEDVFKTSSTHLQCVFTKTNACYNSNQSLSTLL